MASPNLQIEIELSIASIIEECLQILPSQRISARNILDRLRILKPTTNFEIINMKNSCQNLTIQELESKTPSAIILKKI